MARTARPGWDRLTDLPSESAVAFDPAFESVFAPGGQVIILVDLGAVGRRVVGRISLRGVGRNLAELVLGDVDGGNPLAIIEPGSVPRNRHELPFPGNDQIIDDALVAEDDVLDGAHPMPTANVHHAAKNGLARTVVPAVVEPGSAVAAVPAKTRVPNAAAIRAESPRSVVPIITQFSSGNGTR